MSQRASGLTARSSTLIYIRPILGRTAIMRIETRSLRRTSGFFTMAVVSVLGVAACTSGTPAGSSKPGPTALAVAAATVPVDVDPSVYSSGDQVYYGSNFLSTLMTFKKPTSTSALPTSADVTGELASSWMIKPNGIEFTLRSTKSSAGNPLTAEDVVYTYQRAAALKDKVSPVLLGAAGFNTTNPVTAVDDHTVMFNGKPNSISLSVLTVALPGVLDQVEVKAHANASDPWAKDWLATHSASFAPYQVASLVPSQSLSLTGNTNYFRGEPAYKSVLLRAISDSSTRLQLLKSGQVDWARSLAPTDQASVKGASGLTSIISPSASSVNLRADGHNPLLANVKIRQAISYALDRTAIAAGPYQNLATVPTGYLTGIDPGPAGGLNATANVAKAKQLLSDAGYPAGINLTLSSTTADIQATGGSSQAVGVLIASQLKQAGITLTLDSVASRSTLLAGIAANSYQLTYNVVGPLVPDPAYAASLFYASTGTSVTVTIPQVDDLVSQALTQAVGTADRSNTLKNLSDVLINNMPQIPVVTAAHYEAMKSSINGYLPYPGDVVYFDWSQAA